MTVDGTTVPSWVSKVVPLVIGIVAITASYMTTSSVAEGAKESTRSLKLDFDKHLEKSEEKFDKVTEQYHELDKSLFQLRGAIKENTEQQRAFMKALEEFSSQNR